MDFQVLTRRRLKRKSLSLIAILGALLFAMQLYEMVLIDLGLARPRGPSGGGGIQAAGAAALIGCLVYIWRLRRQQRRLQQALQNLDLRQLTNEGKFGLFLYLRSFRMGRSTMMHRLIPYAAPDRSLSQATFGGTGFNLEENISNAIVPHGLLIAIGDRNDSYGAGKIVVGDEEWKDRFHWLATHSWMIFVQPDLTPSVRWEIDQLVGNVSYLRKTVWFMPYSGDEWAEIRDGLRQDVGVVLPHHCAGGGMFRLRPDSGDVPIAPSLFERVLTRVLEEPNRDSKQFDVEHVWEQALSDDRAIRANDERLREIGREIPLFSSWLPDGTGATKRGPEVHSGPPSTVELAAAANDGETKTKKENVTPQTVRVAKKVIADGAILAGTVAIGTVVIAFGLYQVPQIKFWTGKLFTSEQDFPHKLEQMIALDNERGGAPF